VDAQGLAVWARATDAADNTSDPVKSVLQIDITAPSVTVATSPTNVIAGTDGAVWAKSTSVAISASTAGAPTSSIEYKLGAAGGDEPAGDWTEYLAPVPVNAQGLAVWARATDAADNISVPVKSVLQIDTTSPVATLTVPSPLQIGDVAFATASCTDALPGSGIKAEGGCVFTGDVNPVTGELDTSSPGTKSVTLTATDNAGNKHEGLAEYTVVLRVCELYDATKSANPGSNYTIKLQICDAQGQPTADNGKLTLTAIEAYRLEDGVVVETFPITPSFSGNSNGGFEFRFSGKDKQYVYNLSTQESWGVGDFVLGFVVGPLATQPREDNSPTNFAHFILR
jgi:hypothetical protein